MRRAQEEDLVYKVLWRLTDMVVANLREVKVTVESMAVFDFVYAKGKYSLDVGGVEPGIVEGPKVDLRGARHPLLGEKAVPLDTSEVQFSWVGRGKDSRRRCLPRCRAFVYAMAPGSSQVKRNALALTPGRGRSVVDSTGDLATGTFSRYQDERLCLPSRRQPPLSRAA